MSSITRGPKFKLSRRLGLNVCGHPKAMNRAVRELQEVIRSLHHTVSSYLKSRDLELTTEYQKSR